MNTSGRWRPKGDEGNLKVNMSYMVIVSELGEVKIVNEPTTLLVLRTMFSGMRRRRTFNRSIRPRRPMAFF